MHLIMVSEQTERKRSIDRERKEERVSWPWDCECSIEFSCSISLLYDQRWLWRAECSTHRSTCAGQAPRACSSMCARICSLASPRPWSAAADFLLLVLFVLLASSRSIVWGANCDELCIRRRRLVTRTDTSTHRCLRWPARPRCVRWPSARQVRVPRTHTQDTVRICSCTQRRPCTDACGCSPRSGWDKRERETQGPSAISSRNEKNRERERKKLALTFWSTAASFHSSLVQYIKQTTDAKHIQSWKRERLLVNWFD